MSDATLKMMMAAWSNKPFAGTPEREAWEKGCQLGWKWAEQQSSSSVENNELRQALSQAEDMLSKHIEEFHDFDYQPHEVPAELAQLRQIQHHLLGSLMDEPPRSPAGKDASNCVHRIQVTPRAGAPHGAGFACRLSGSHCQFNDGCGYTVALSATESERS